MKRIKTVSLDFLMVRSISKKFSHFKAKKQMIKLEYRAYKGADTILPRIFNDIRSFYESGKIGKNDFGEYTINEIEGTDEFSLKRSAWYRYAIKGFIEPIEKGDTESALIHIDKIVDETEKAIDFINSKYEQALKKNRKITSGLESSLFITKRVEKASKIIITLSPFTSISIGTSIICEGAQSIAEGKSAKVVLLKMGKAGLKELAFLGIGKLANKAFKPSTKDLKKFSNAKKVFHQKAKELGNLKRHTKAFENKGLEYIVSKKFTEKTQREIIEKVVTAQKAGAATSTSASVLFTILDD